MKSRQMQRKKREPTIVVFYRVYWTSEEKCVRLYDRNGTFIYHGRINVSSLQELASFVTVLERKNTLVTFDSESLELRLRVGAKATPVKLMPAS
jgi:hypothetical protein